MANGGEHETVLTEWGPTIVTGFGAALTFLSGAVAWAFRDRAAFERELLELRHRVRTLEDVHERWEDGDLLQSQISANDSRVREELAGMKTNLKNMEQRLNRWSWRRSQGRDGEE